MRIALFPGSFDPVTNGHLDVLGRALAVYDRIVVAILENSRKKPLLTAGERLAVLTASSRDAGLPLERIELIVFDGLAIDAARTHGGSAIVRGLRGVGDFEVELRLALNNRVLAPDLDTVFFATAAEHAFVSSSLVKEIASFGGDVSGMVPRAALAALAAALPDRPGHDRPAHGAVRDE